MIDGVDPISSGGHGGLPPAEGKARIVTLAELRRRFFPNDTTNRRACSLMRELGHVERGGDMWTTEGAIAEWLAREMVPAMGWPEDDPVYDPLENIVARRVVALVRTLADAGAVVVCGAGPRPGETAAR